MLKSTTELIEYLKLDKSSRAFTPIEALVYSVLKCGDKTDADALLVQYLTKPYDFHYRYLLPIFKKFGDNNYAEQIFNTFIHQHKFDENASPEILETLGYLKYKPVKQILADYAFGNLKADYYLAKNAILGLLNFNCEEYQHIIHSEIEKCYGKNLFSEFIPALVSKLKDNTLILENLFELGTKYASTDCNAGIILGFSLCGHQGRKYFEQILFDRNWEAHSNSTGTIRFTYQGIKNLGITFKELYYKIKLRPKQESLEYGLTVFLALLEMKIKDYETNKKESLTDIYNSLFKWKNENESDNLMDLAKKVSKKDEAYRIEELILLKMKEEAILKNYIS